MKKFFKIFIVRFLLILFSNSSPYSSSGVIEEDGEISSVN